MGIEFVWLVWKVGVLLLNYICKNVIILYKSKINF